METNTALEYMIYRRQFDESGTAHDHVSMTLGLSNQDFNLWRGIVSLEPFAGHYGAESESIGLFAGPDQLLILARAQYVNAESDDIIYQFTGVPVEEFLLSAGNLRLLLANTSHSLQEIEDGLEVIELIRPTTWTDDLRRTALEKIAKYDLTVPDLFPLLGMALHPNKAELTGFEQSLDFRLNLVEALMMLLPPPARPLLTFSTCIRNSETVRGRIVFNDGKPLIDSNRWQLDATSELELNETLQQIPYIQLLTEMWTDDLDGFIERLDEIDEVAVHLMQGHGFSEGLSLVAQRQTLDTQILDGQQISVSDLQEVLEGPAPPQDDLRNHYLRQMLTHALTEREPETVEVVLRYMADFPAIETLIREELNNTIETTPDDVYFFLRTSMSKQGMVEGRLPILQRASEMSLRLASEDADSEALLTWFNLVAREPEEYGLVEILNAHIRAAQLDAHQSGELGRDLLAFVARRTPDLLNEFLEDDELIAALGAPLGPAVRDFDAEATTEVFEIGREIALVVLHQATLAAPEDEAAAQLFDGNIIRYLWALIESDYQSNLDERYHPQTLVDVLIDAGSTWLPQSGLAILLDQIVVHQDHERLIQLSQQIEDTKFFVDQLALIFQNRATEAADVLEIVESLVEAKILQPQEQVNLLVQVAAIRDWDPSTRPLIEHTSRMLQQDRELTVSLDVLWPMLRLACDDNRMETVASTVTRRLLVYAEAIQDDTEMIQMIQRLHQRLEWSKYLRGYIVSWWRDYLQEQPLARLQQLERALDGKKELMQEYAVLQTTVAIRRMLGQGTLEEFAEAVNTSYKLLQTLSESFDPEHRQFIAFDEEAVNDALKANAGSLTPDLTRVLARNLRELAQLIVTMSDFRTKPAIMRREEDVERQLLEGEQAPHSAIDTMRWLTGLLMRDQDEGDTNEE